MIKKIVSTIFKALYSIIILLNLQFALLVAVVGGILYFTGTLKSEGAKIIFAAVAATSVLYAVIATFAKLFGLNKKKEKKTAKTKENTEERRQPTQTDYSSERIIESAERPKYFRVEQNPNMVMAEYDDRYELFDVTDGTMKKIRTDYK